MHSQAWNTNTLYSIRNSTLVECGEKSFYIDAWQKLKLMKWGGKKTHTGTQPKPWHIWNWIYNVDFPYESYYWSCRKFRGGLKCAERVWERLVRCSHSVCAFQFSTSHTIRSQFILYGVHGIFDLLPPLPTSSAKRLHFWFSMHVPKKTNTRWYAHDICHFMCSILWMKIALKMS